jgi:hypothetical protein
MLQKKLVRAAFACVMALGPLCSACELVFDFDRTPLQEVYEAGPPADSSTGGGSGDATPDRSSSGGQETGSTADAGQDAREDG